MARTTNRPAGASSEALARRRDMISRTLALDLAREEEAARAAQQEKEWDDDADHETY